MMTQAQRDWIEMHQMIKKATPLFNDSKAPTNPYRLQIYHIIKYWAFDVTILLLIVINILAMGMQYEQISTSLQEKMNIANYIFTAVFVLEALFKIIAFGFTTYIHNSWNQFDLFVVMSSLLHILMNDFLNTDNSTAILAYGPQIIKSMRILRLSRLLRLTDGLQGLQQILQTMEYSIPQILNIVFLLFLFYFITSCLAWNLFQNSKEGMQLNDKFNFFTFKESFFTLFRISTGEDWQAIMTDLYDESKYGFFEDF
jgi:hypothetical protein